VLHARLECPVDYATHTCGLGVSELCVSPTLSVSCTLRLALLRRWEARTAQKYGWSCL